MKVLKFGGTSVGTVESLRNVKQIVEALDSPAVVVVSALGGLTDKLIATARMAAEGNPAYIDEVHAMRLRHHDIIYSLVPGHTQVKVREYVDALLEQLKDVYTGLSLIRDLPDRTLNQVVSFGERMSSYIVAGIIDNAVHADSLEFIKTETWFNRNIADRKLTESLIKETLSNTGAKIVVCGGFISRDRDSEEITNLGRGGSDYTAALIAAALDAEELQIWTDVDGFMTADPRIIKEARVIPQMSFIESMELCSFGAKVIYPPTIYPVFHKDIPIRILNTHNPSAPGTLITDKSSDNCGPARGISSIKSTAMITVTGNLTANVAEINSRTFNAMARNGISVFLVAQPDSETSFSLAMAASDAVQAVEAINDEFAPELQSGEVKEINLTEQLSIIAVVREDMRSQHGLGARLVHTLLRDSIPVLAISDGTSETTIALVVNDVEMEPAMKLIHNVCFS